MAEKTGRVTHIFDDGWATVVTERGDACHNCEASQFCHALTDCTSLETKALNKAGAAAGDRVTIQLSSHTLLKGAFVLYLIPVLGLLTGAVAGSGFNKQLALGETAAALLFGLAGLVLGFIITVMISKKLECKNKLTPIITRIIRRKMEYRSSSAQITRLS